jgi:lysozyme family protein
MADFAKYFPLLLANEGGYVNDPHDPGGETWRGVARAYHPNWAGWKLIDNYKSKADWPADCRVFPRNKFATAILQKDKDLAGLVRSFYQGQFWDSLRLGEITNQCIASQLCDIGVNSGTGRVGLLAQYVLANSFDWKGAIDGKIGPQTIAAINAAHPSAYYDALVAMRRSFYQYRAGHNQGMAQGLTSFLNSVHLKPDAAMQRYLPSWLNRINAIPFSA